MQQEGDGIEGNASIFVDAHKQKGCGKEVCGMISKHIALSSEYFN